MSPFTDLTNWINIYGPIYRFIGHKIVHIFGAAMLGIALSVYSSIIAVVAVLFVAIGKEIADEKKSPGIPMSYHMYDIVITVLGGVGGIGFYVMAEPSTPLFFILLLILGIITGFGLFLSEWQFEED